MIRAYTLMGWLLHPILIVWLRWRVRSGKEDAQRIYERFGKARLARPQGKLCWIHAASVGESQSVLPLIERLLNGNPKLHVLLTTGTVSSANIMQKRLPDRAMHQYVAVDTPLAVSRFLKHWKPDLAIRVESEFWPTTLLKMDAYNIPRLLINARISDRSYKRWHRFRKQFHRLTRPFVAILCGSIDDQKRFKRLGIESATHVGNLKYDVAPLPYDTKAMGELITLMGDRHCWLAASTHPGEEEQIIEVHKMLKQTHADVLTIIVPRHPRRHKEIASLIGQHKLTLSLRSKNQRLLPETEIYLADTLGELGMFYRLVGIVAMCGSFVPHGGHNPIEAALLDCAIACGPHMHNFSQVVDDLKADRGIVQVEDAKQLSEKIDQWMRDHETQEAFAKAAHEAIDGRAGAVDHIVKITAPYLGIVQEEAQDDAA